MNRRAKIKMARLEALPMEQRIAESRRKATEYARMIPWEWITMTQATVCIGGTSGRANIGLVKRIEACERMGTVEIEQRGRIRLVRRLAGTAAASGSIT